MTSGKVSKARRKDENSEMRADLETQLTAATEAQADKLAKSKEHLISQLRMVTEKYLTVNGYMQARATYKEAAFASDGTGHAADDSSRKLAQKLSALASDLADKLETIDVMDLDETFMDGLLEADFVKKQKTIEEITEQLLVVNLLQNIGPSIDDIVTFREGSAAGIAKLEEALDELDDKKDGPTLVQ